MDVAITSSGRFRYACDSGKPLHYHSDYQIQLVIAGEALVTLDEVSFLVCSGELVFCRKGKMHAFHATKVEGVKMLEVKFTTSDAELEAILQGIEMKFEDQEKQLYSLLSRIVLEGQRKPHHYKYMSGTLLMECLLVMNRICLQKSLPVYELLPLHQVRLVAAASESQLLDNVDDYINKHIEQSFSLEDLAKGCGYNQDYLYRVIKKKTGLSSIKYVNLVKFERALFLIQNTEQTLTEIGWNLGFENLQYFSRFFKQHGGITPSEYITKVRSTTRTDY